MTRLIFALMLFASPALACGAGSDQTGCGDPPPKPTPPPIETPERPRQAPPQTPPVTHTKGDDSEQPGQSTGRNYDVCCIRDDGAVLWKSPLHLWGPQQCLKDVAAGKRPKCGGEG